MVSMESGMQVGYVVGGLVLSLAVLRFLGYVLIRKRWLSPPRVFKPDVIYIHMFPREYSKGVINLSPFAIKLESWLRLHKLPYEVVETNRMSKGTRQIPYMILNGDEYCDSNLIIQHLCKRYDIDPSDGLTPEEQAISRAFIKMMEEHTCWTYFLPRYSYQPQEFAKVFQISAPWPLNTIITNKMSKGVLRRSAAHGIGRHSREVIAASGQDDIRAISNYLGSKRFMFGDTITTLDCCLFGHLSQIVYVDFPFPHNEVLTSECTNVVTYMNRVKAQLWHDWEEILSSVQYKF